MTGVDEEMDQGKEEQDRAKVNCNLNVKEEALLGPMKGVVVPIYNLFVSSLITLFNLRSITPFYSHLPTDLYLQY